MGTFVVLALVVLAVCLAARSVCKERRRGGGCGGDCSGCSHCSGHGR